MGTTAIAGSGVGAGGAAPALGYSTWSGSLMGGAVTATPSQPDGSGRALWTVTLQRGDTSISTQVTLSGQFGAAQLAPGSAAKSALEAQLSPARGSIGGSASAAPAARGAAEVQALKQTLQGFNSGGLTATDVQLALDHALSALDSGQVTGNNVTYLRDLMGQAQGKLSGAQEQTSAKAVATIQSLGAAIRAFGQGADRRYLNDALAAARGVPQSGWSNSQKAELASYVSQASARLSAPAAAKGAQEVQALKQTLQDVGRGGLSATDLKIALDSAAHALEQGRVTGDNVTYLKDLMGQAGRRLDAAQDAGAAHIKRLGEAVRAFDRGGSRDSLNAALSAARSAPKGGWSAAELANLKTLDAQATGRLWPKGNPILTPEEKVLLGNREAEARTDLGKRENDALFEANRAAARLSGGQVSNLGQVVWRQRWLTDVNLNIELSAIARRHGFGGWTQLLSPNMQQTALQRMSAGTKVAAQPVWRPGADGKPVLDYTARTPPKADSGATPTKVQALVDKRLQQLVAGTKFEGKVRSVRELANFSDKEVPALLAQLDGVARAASSGRVDVKRLMGPQPSAQTKVVLERTLARQVAPLRRQINIASAEVTANEQHWVKLSNTKNLLQRSLDNGALFDIAFTPAAVLRSWDLAHGRQESRFALGDGFARYDQARAQLNSIFDQAASGRITRDAAQAQVKSVMAKYSAGHAKQIQGFAQRAEAGALPVTAAKAGSPTVAAILVGQKTKGSPAGAALAGTVSYAVRTTQDYGAWWVYNKSPWAGAYDPDVKAYAPRPTAQSNARNLILASGDAVTATVFGKAPGAIGAGKLSLGGAAITSAPRVLANTFALSGVTALPTSLLGTAVDQQFDQATQAKQVQQTEADLAKWKQTSLAQQKQAFEAERPQWLQKQAMQFERDKQAALQKLRADLAAQKQTAMAQIRAELAGMPQAQRQAALGVYSQQLDQRIETRIVQQAADYEAQRAPARQRAEAFYGKQQSSKAATFAKLLDAKAEVINFRARAALDQAQLDAPLELADQAWRQTVSIPVNYGVGLIAGFLPQAKGGAPVTKWTDPLHFEALPALAEVGHGAFSGVADVAVQGLVVDGKLPDQKTLVQAAVNEAFELPFETGAARNSLNAARLEARQAPRLSTTLPAVATHRKQQPASSDATVPAKAPYSNLPDTGSRPTLSAKPTITSTPLTVQPGLNTSATSLTSGSANARPGKLRPTPADATAPLPRPLHIDTIRSAPTQDVLAFFDKPLPGHRLEGQSKRAQQISEWGNAATTATAVVAAADGAVAQVDAQAKWRADSQTQRAPQAPTQRLETDARPTPQVGEEKRDNPPESGAAHEKKLADGVFLRANRVVLRSLEMEVLLPPGWQFGPLTSLNHLNGLDSGYISLTGHGALMPSYLRDKKLPTLTTVPEGTRVVLLAPPGAVLGAKLGEAVNNRAFVGYDSQAQKMLPINAPFRVLEAGQTLPNYVISEPEGLKIPARDDVIAPRRGVDLLLSETLRPNMGTVVINTCGYVKGAPRTQWSHLAFEPHRVIDRDLRLLGLPSKEINFGQPQDKATAPRPHRTDAKTTAAPRLDPNGSLSHELFRQALEAAPPSLYDARGFASKDEAFTAASRVMDEYNRLQQPHNGGVELTAAIFSMTVGKTTRFYSTLVHKASVARGKDGLLRPVEFEVPSKLDSRMVSKREAPVSATPAEQLRAPLPPQAVVVAWVHSHPLADVVSPVAGPSLADVGSLLLRARMQGWGGDASYVEQRVQSAQGPVDVAMQLELKPAYWLAPDPAALADGVEQGVLDINDWVTLRYVQRPGDPPQSPVPLNVISHDEPSDSFRSHLLPHNVVGAAADSPRAPLVEWPLARSRSQDITALPLLQGLGVELPFLERASRYAANALRLPQTFLRRYGENGLRAGEPFTQMPTPQMSADHGAYVKEVQSWHRSLLTTLDFLLEKQRGGNDLLIADPVSGEPWSLREAVAGLRAELPRVQAPSVDGAARSRAATYTDFYRSLLDDVARPLTGALMDGGKHARERRAQIAQEIRDLYEAFGREIVDQELVGNEKFATSRRNPMHFVGSGAQTRLERRLDDLRSRFADEIAAGRRGNPYGLSKQGDLAITRELDDVVLSLVARSPLAADSFLAQASPPRADGTRAKVHVLGVAQSGATLAAVAAQLLRRVPGGDKAVGQFGVLIPLQRESGGDHRATRFRSTLDAGQVSPGDTILLVDNGRVSDHTLQTAVKDLASLHDLSRIQLMFAEPHQSIDHVDVRDYGPIPVWGLLSGRPLLTPMSQGQGDDGTGSHAARTSQRSTSGEGPPAEPIGAASPVARASVSDPVLQAATVSRPTAADRLARVRQGAAVFDALLSGSVNDGPLRTTPLLSPGELRWLMYFNLTAGDHEAATMLIKSEGGSADAARLLERLNLPTRGALERKLLQVPGLQALPRVHPDRADVVPVLAAAAQVADVQAWPVAVVVVDARGKVIGQQNHHDPQRASTDIARLKALTALRSGADSNELQRAFFDVVEQGDVAALEAAIAQYRQAGQVPMEGGVLLAHGGVVVGAIGVSGVASDQDAQVARAGATAFAAGATPHATVAVPAQTAAAQRTQPRYGAPLRADDARQLMQSLPAVRAGAVVGVVVDSTGQVVASHAPEGASDARLAMATQRAQTANGLRQPTARLAAGVAQNNPQTMRLQAVPGLALEPGGAPLRDAQGHVIGAIGLVSAEPVADGRLADQLAARWQQQLQQKQRPQSGVQEQLRQQQQQGNELTRQPPLPRSRPEWYASWERHMRDNGTDMSSGTRDQIGRGLPPSMSWHELRYFVLRLNSPESVAPEYSPHFDGGPPQFAIHEAHQALGAKPDFLGESSTLAYGLNAVDQDMSMLVGGLADISDGAAFFRNYAGFLARFTGSRTGSPSYVLDEARQQLKAGQSVDAALLGVMHDVLGQKQGLLHLQSEKTAFETFRNRMLDARDDPASQTALLDTYEKHLKQGHQRTDAAEHEGYVRALALRDYVVTHHDFSGRPLHISDLRIDFAEYRTHLENMQTQGRLPGLEQVRGWMDEAGVPYVRAAVVAVQDATLATYAASVVEPSAAWSAKDKASRTSTAQDTAFEDEVPRQLKSLDPLQQEIFGGLIDGTSKADLAALLGMAPDTFDTQLQSIAATLNAPTIDAAVDLAIKEEWYSDQLDADLDTEQRSALLARTDEHFAEMGRSPAFAALSALQRMRVAHWAASGFSPQAAARVLGIDAAALSTMLGTAASQVVPGHGTPALARKVQSTLDIGRYPTMTRNAVAYAQVLLAAEKTSALDDRIRAQLAQWADCGFNVERTARQLHKTPSGISNSVTKTWQREEFGTLEALKASLADTLGLRRPGGRSPATGATIEKLTEAGSANLQALLKGLAGFAQLKPFQQVLIAQWAADSYSPTAAARRLGITKAASTATALHSAGLALGFEPGTEPLRTAVKRVLSSVADTRAPQRVSDADLDGAAQTHPGLAAIVDKLSPLARANYAVLSARVAGNSAEAAALPPYQRALVAEWAAQGFSASAAESALGYPPRSNRVSNQLSLIASALRLPDTPALRMRVEDLLQPTPLHKTTHDLLDPAQQNRVNPGWRDDRQRLLNCRECVLAFDDWAQGEPLMPAAPSRGGDASMGPFMQKYGARFTHATDLAALLAQVEQAGDGALGIVRLDLGDDLTHYVNVANVGGRVYLIDPQLDATTRPPMAMTADTARRDTSLLRRFMMPQLENWAARSGQPYARQLLDRLHGVDAAAADTIFGRSANLGLLLTRMGHAQAPPQSLGAAAKPKAPRVADWPQFASPSVPDAVLRAGASVLPPELRRALAGEPSRWVLDEPQQQSSPKDSETPTGLRAAWARDVTKGVTTIKQAHDAYLRELAAYYRSGVNPALANRRAFVDGLLHNDAHAVEFIEIPGVLKPINDHVGHVAADKLLAQVLDSAADVARQNPGVTVYQLDALRLAVEGSDGDIAAFGDAFEARMKRLELSYVAGGMRYANRRAGDAHDPSVREGLPVVRARLAATAAGSRKELLAQGVEALDRASERLKQSEAEGGTGELDPERGAHLRKLTQTTAPGKADPLQVNDPGLDPALQPKDDERRATQQLSAAMLAALKAQTDRVIGNDPAQLPAAKRAIEDLVFKAFSTDESFGRHLGNQLAFDRAEGERKRQGIRTAHGFADVGAVGVTNRELSRFGGDVVLTTVHATAAEVARNINQRLRLAGGEAIEVFAVGGDEIRFISSKPKYVRLFAEEFAEAMRQATIDGVAGDTPGTAKRVVLSAIPVYVGVGKTKQAAEAQSNAAKAGDPQRVPGQLPRGYRVEPAQTQLEQEMLRMADAPVAQLLALRPALKEELLQLQRTRGVQFEITDRNLRVFAAGAAETEKVAVLSREHANHFGMVVGPWMAPLAEQNAATVEGMARDFKDALAQLRARAPAWGRAPPFLAGLAAVPEPQRALLRAALTSGSVYSSAKALQDRGWSLSYQPTQQQPSDLSAIGGRLMLHSPQGVKMPLLDEPAQRTLQQAPDSSGRNLVWLLERSFWPGAISSRLERVVGPLEGLASILGHRPLPLSQAVALRPQLGDRLRQLEQDGWRVMLNPADAHGWRSGGLFIRRPDGLKLRLASEQELKAHQQQVGTDDDGRSRHHLALAYEKFFSPQNLEAAFQAALGPLNGVDAILAEPRSVIARALREYPVIERRLRQLEHQGWQVHLRPEGSLLTAPNGATTPWLDASKQGEFRELSRRLTAGQATVKQVADAVDDYALRALGQSFGPWSGVSSITDVAPAAQAHPFSRLIAADRGFLQTLRAAQAQGFSFRGDGDRVVLDGHRSISILKPHLHERVWRAHAMTGVEGQAALTSGPFSERSLGAEVKLEMLGMLREAGFAVPPQMLEEARQQMAVTASRRAAADIVAHQQQRQQEAESALRAGTDVQLMAGFGKPSANQPILDALKGTGLVKDGQLKGGTLKKLMSLQHELAAKLGVADADVPLHTAALAAAWANWDARRAEGSSAVRRSDELNTQLKAALAELSPQRLGAPPIDMSTASELASFYQFSAWVPPRPELLRGMEAVRTSTVGQRQALDLGSGAAVATGAMLADASGFKVLAVDAEPLAQQYAQPLLDRYGSGRLQFVPADISNTVLPWTDLVWAGLSLPYLGPYFARTWSSISNAILPGGVFAGDFFGNRHSTTRHRDANLLAFHDRSQVQRLFDGFDLLELNEVDDQTRNNKGASRTHTFNVVARKQGGEDAAAATGSTAQTQALPLGWGIRTVINPDGAGTFELTNERGDAQAEIEVEGLHRLSGVAQIVSLSAQDARLLARAEQTMAQMGATQLIVARVRPQAEAFFTAAGYRPDPRSNSGGWVKDIGTPRLSIQANAAQEPLTSIWAQPPITSQYLRTVWSRAGSGDEPASNRPILEALQGTDLLHNGQLKDGAMTRLLEAQREVAREFGLRREDVSMHAAAFKAAELYWTAQVGHDDAAFTRAHAAHAQLRGAVEALPRQPRTAAPASEPPRKNEPVVAVDPDEQVASFLSGVPWALRTRWQQQLTGGPALEQLLKREAQAARPLTQDSVRALVSRNEPLVRPPLREWQGKVEFSFDSAYELRFGNRMQLQSLLREALSQQRNQAMQIRTPDGARRFDLYRHDAGGYTMLDQSTGSAVPVSSDDDVVREVTDSLRVIRDERGSLVVSYGSAPAITAEQPQFYLTREQIEDMLALPAAQRLAMTAQTVQAIDDLISRGEITVAPGVWDAAQHMPVVSSEMRAERALEVFDLLMFSLQQPSHDPLVATHAMGHLRAAQREATLQEQSRQARTLFEQLTRDGLARLPDLDGARERQAQLVALADALESARHPDAQRVRAMAVIALQRIEAEEAARSPRQPQRNDAAEATRNELARLLAGDAAQLNAADRLVAEIEATAAALSADPGADAVARRRAADLATVAHEMLRQSRADRSRQAGDAQMMLSPRDEPTPNHELPMQPLAGTHLIQRGRLTADAVIRITQARRELAAEVGQRPQDISLDIAALKVGQDYWTARIGREADAFERARGYQLQLEQAMAPLRQQATARIAVEHELEVLRGEYALTVSAIREIKPDFDETDIGRAAVGEVTLQQLEEAMPPADHARLSLQVARQYLDHYRAAAQPTSASSAVRDFLSQVAPATRLRWETQLFGSAPLHDLLMQQAQAGRPLDTPGVLQLVSLNEPVLRPPEYVESSMSVLYGPRALTAQLDSAYELRFRRPEFLQSPLADAFQQLPSAPMQIRTADNTRRFDVYRHAGQGQTIIDQSSGYALSGAQEDPAGAVIAALGIGEHEAGALVISYGDSPAVMSDKPRFYWTQQQIDDWLDKPPAERAPVTRAVQQELLALALKSNRETSPDWDVDSRENLNGALWTLGRLGIEPNRIDDHSARHLLVLVRGLARNEREQWLGRDDPPQRLQSLADYLANLLVLSQNLPLTHLVDSRKVEEWNARLIGGPSLHDVLWWELQADRPLTTENIDRAVSRHTPGSTLEPQ